MVFTQFQSILISSPKTWRSPGIVWPWQGGGRITQIDWGLRDSRKFAQTDLSILLPVNRNLGRAPSTMFFDTSKSQTLNTMAI